MLSFRLYREYGALNSRPVFDAFERAIIKSGHKVVSQHEDIPVIWSVLWRGRMKPNSLIYQQSLIEKKPLIIIEVGNLKRGQTWRVSLSNINRLGYFGNHENLDVSRPSKLQIGIRPLRSSRKSSILITTQHDQSLQWQGQPHINNWLINLITKVRENSDRNLIIRPHPRCPINYLHKIKNITIDCPKKLENTYDDFDINFDHHCVINHNSGPTVHAAIDGTPVICHESGLAYDVSDRIENIENIALPDREQWFLKLCHTEWTVDEISSGVPLHRLLPKIILDLGKH